MSRDLELHGECKISSPLRMSDFCLGGERSRQKLQSAPLIFWPLTILSQNPWSLWSLDVACAVMDLVLHLFFCSYLHLCVFIDVCKGSIPLPCVFVLRVCILFVCILPGISWSAVFHLSDTKWDLHVQAWHKWFISFHSLNLRDLEIIWVPACAVRRYVLLGVFWLVPINNPYLSEVTTEEMTCWYNSAVPVKGVSFIIIPYPLLYKYCIYITSSLAGISNDL